jgi:ribosome biogenesis GTPase
MSLETLDLKDYGFNRAEFSFAEDYLRENPGEDLIPGRIVECRRERYRAVCRYGEADAELRGAFYYRLREQEEFPAVGDFVLLKYNREGSSLISALMPRRSKFSRANLSGHQEGYAKFVREEVTASNFDYVFILSSLNQDFNINRFARYLSAAWRSGGFPVILLSKADLCADPAARAGEARKIAGDAPVIPCSAKTGYGLRDLAPFLEPAKTVVFLGSSGVGKSSLLNALAGERLMEVKEIREDDGKGRHTTTHRQLFRLDSGALVIDTPGMRELALYNAEEGIRAAFAEVEELITQCRFSNCTHSGEPGCAVGAALEAGTLSPEQWKNYCIQRREAAYVERRSAYLSRKKEWQKSIARNARNAAKDARRGGEEED